MGDRKGAYTVLVGRSCGKSQLGRSLSVDEYSRDGMEMHGLD